MVCTAFPFVSSEAQEQEERKEGTGSPSGSLGPAWPGQLLVLTGAVFPPQALGRQVQRVVSMAALAAVCEAIDQKPELQLDSLDAGPTERFLASLQLNQMLQKPCPEEQSRCVHPLECVAHERGLYCSCWKIHSCFSH